MADSQITVKSDGWKVKVVLGLGGLVVITILAFLYRLEIGLILLVSGSIGAIRLIFWAKHKITLGKLQERQLLAQTQQVELAADRERWQVQQERAIAAKLTAEQYFIERKAGTFVLGDLPFKFYPSASASRELATVQPLALPAPSLDYFSAMSDPLQAYAVVGPQRIGKSILTQHLAQYLARNNNQTCVVIGTKAKAGEWLNCRRYIGNETVPEALKSMLAETTERLRYNRTSPGLCVFLDDWLNTVALDSDLAEQFFLEAATRMLTAGIVPYFLLQSDSKADWGTKHGAQLKNNFVHLILSAPRENGKLDHNRLKGVIIYPAEKEQHPVTLPAGLPMFGESEPSLELAEPIEPQLTEQEQQIANLKAEGLSNRAICQEVFGYVSSNKYPLIEAAVQRANCAK